MLTAVVLAALLQVKPPAPTPMWTGELTLTIKGNGTIEQPYPKIGKQRVTWSVNRSARGRVVLDKMFKGGAIAGTPNTRDTVRYETWIANASQPLDMLVGDTGTYYGPIPGAGLSVTLDLLRISCPTTTPKARAGQIRSSILQFDYEKGTYTWEAPRLITACDQSHMRTPKLGPPAWMNKAPFDLLSTPVELEYEMIYQMNWPDEWVRMMGTFPKGSTEIVLSRTFDFSWRHPLDMKAPVKAELVLVIRKTSS